MNRSRPLNIVSDLPLLDKRSVVLNNALHSYFTKTLATELSTRIAEWTHLDADTVKVNFSGISEPLQGNPILLAYASGDSKVLGGLSVSDSFSRFIVGLATNSDVRVTSEFDKGFLSILFSDFLDLFLAPVLPGLQIFVEPSSLENVRNNPDYFFSKIEFTLGGRKDFILLHLPKDWAFQSRAVPPAIFDIDLKLPIVAGILSLQLHDIRACAPGDLLLPDHAIRFDSIDPTPGMKAKLAINKHTFLDIDLRIEEERWICTFLEEDIIMDNSSTHQLLNNADVQVRVRVGSVAIPLKEIGKISAGFTLELDRTIHEGVELEANGRVFATGELVNIDGRLGVRVRSLLRDE